MKQGTTHHLKSNQLALEVASAYGGGANLVVYVMWLKYRCYIAIYTILSFIHLKVLSFTLKYQGHFCDINPVSDVIVLWQSPLDHKAF